MANSEAALRFEKEFDAKIAERAQIRTLANGNGDGISLTVTGKSNLLKRCATLLGRLQEDFESNQAHTQQQTHDLKRQIIDIKNRLPNPNLLLLCGGFAPEVTAYKRLNAAPLGKVIIQEVDLHAVGVAVAAHPEVEFCIVIDRPSSRCPRKPGDVRILTNLQVVREVEVLIGGIHHISITNPCQSFSLAGKKDGFNTESGRLLWDCCTAVRNVSASSEMPSYLAENVPSTIEVNETSDWYLPEPDARYFPACASMCSPCIRKRKFAMNRPPVVCSTGPNSEPGKPPSLDGNQQSLCAAAIVKTNRMVHPDMMKLPCQLNSNPMRNECIWEQTDECLDPVRSSPTPDEAERAMGYRENEVGITQKSVERAVQKRIEEHDFEQNGCLVSLKGCASDPDYPAEDVPPLRRLQLLGNSECVTLLEAFMWSDQQLFPPVS